MIYYLVDVSIFPARHEKQSLYQYNIIIHIFSVRPSVRMQVED